MIERKIITNKKNGQFIFIIPKKDFPFLKGKKPKSLSLNIKEEDFKF